MYVGVERASKDGIQGEEDMAHVCTHEYIHTHTHTCSQAQLHNLTRSQIHTILRTPSHTFILTHPHVCTHVCHARASSFVRTLTHSYIP